jgi:hypothetical protein
MQTFPWSDVLSVDAQWRLREEPAETIVDRLKRMLQALEPLHEGFRSLMWTSGPMRSLFPLPARFDELAKLFAPQRIYDEVRKRRTSDGFSFSADSRLGGKRFIQIHIRAGKHVDCAEQLPWPNFVSIATVIFDPQGEDRAIVEALEPALEAVTAAWEPERAASFSRNRAAPRHDPARPCFYNGARFIYLTPKQAEMVAAASSGAAMDSLCEGSCSRLTTDKEDAVSAQCPLDAVIQALIAATTP